MGPRTGQREVNEPFPGDVANSPEGDNLSMGRGTCYDAASVGDASVSKWGTLIVLVSLAVLILGLVRQVAPQPFQAPDFHNTYRASMTMRQGKDLYAPAVAWASAYKPGQPLADQYFYAPTYALLLIPLTFLSYQTAIAVWGAFLMVFLCISIYALLRAIGPPPSWALVLGIAALASLMSAVRAEYFLGQANMFMLACFCSSIWARQVKRPMLAGCLLALALVTKPMLLLTTGFLLWKREFAFAFTTIAGFLVLLLAPFLWLGGDALGDMFWLWNFYSSQYLSFSENITPRGMFERLFNANPYLPPLFVAPMLARVLWLGVVTVVFVLLLAIVRPEPLERNGRSLVEFGAILSGLMLISPLTEPPYLVLLIMPLMAAIIYLRGTKNWRERPYLWIAAAVAALWFWELVPRSLVEPRIWQAFAPAGSPMSANRLQTALIVLLAPTHFYILLGTFALQVYVLRHESGRPLLESVGRFVRNSPALVGEWFKDFAALRTATSKR
jgi:hypothetical protein